MTVMTRLKRLVTYRQTEPRGPNASSAARAQASQRLIPDDATVSRMRRFYLNHGLQPVEGLVGEHRSRRKGSAPEFSDYAPYTPGDDVRRIDWNAYARFETLYVRESEITTELDVHVLLDTSASMDWTGDQRRDTKLNMARKVAAAIGWIGLARSDRMLITGFTDRTGPTYGPLQGRGMVVPMANHLAELRGGGKSALPTVLTDYMVGRPRAGMMIIITDMVGVSPAAIDESLARLSNNRWRTCFVLIEDPLEANPGLLGAADDVLEVEDPETGVRQRVNTRSATVERYVSERNAWVDELRAIAMRRSAPLVTVRNDERIDPDVLITLDRAGVIVS
jgi:uncharacterized protein (DUF58 family)